MRRGSRWGVSDRQVRIGICSLLVKRVWIWRSALDQARLLLSPFLSRGIGISPRHRGCYRM